MSDRYPRVVWSSKKKKEKSQARLIRWRLRSRRSARNARWKVHESWRMKRIFSGRKRTEPPAEKFKPATDYTRYRESWEKRSACTFSAYVKFLINLHRDRNWQSHLLSYPELDLDGHLCRLNFFFQEKFVRLEKLYRNESGIIHFSSSPFHFLTYVLRRIPFEINLCTQRV